MIFSSNAFCFVFGVFAAVFNAKASTKGFSSVELLTAQNHVILAKTGISMVPDSVITGNITILPITEIAVTNFSFTKDWTGTSSTSEQLSGNTFVASEYVTPIPAHFTISVRTMEAAYTGAAGHLDPNASRINHRG